MLIVPDWFYPVLAIISWAILTIVLIVSLRQAKLRRDIESRMTKVYVRQNGKWVPVQGIIDVRLNFDTEEDEL